MCEARKSRQREWSPTTLGNLCDIDPEALKGSTPPDYRFRYVDISSVSPLKIAAELQETSFAEAPSRARKRVRRDDVLMSTVRPNLKAFARVKVDGDLVASTAFAVLRARMGVSDPKFIEQVLFSPDIEAQIEALVAGSNYPAITVPNVKRLRVMAPPPDEQRRIAELLSAVDELASISESHMDKLVRTRAGFVQQELLPVASHAEEVFLGAIAPLVTSGSRGWASYYADEGAIFLRIGNLTRKHPNLRFDDVIRVNVPTGGEGARTKLKEGDVLISITADLGIVGCVPAGLGEAYINQHIALARVADASMCPRWVAHTLASSYGSNQIAKLNDGGAKAGLNLPTIRALKVPKASPEQQRNIVGILDAMDAQIASEQASIAKLMLQKQGLLRSLLGTSVHVRQGAAS